MTRPLALAAAFLAACPLAAQPKVDPPKPKPDLPRVLLLGDSIRLGYAPLVAAKLAGVAEVVSPPANGGDTANTLKSLDGWLDGKPFTVVHFNNGIHDSKYFPARNEHQVSPDQYAANLKALAERLRKLTPHVVFATTTPVDDHPLGRTYAVRDRDVTAYNERAVKAMLGLGVPVNDLNRVVRDGGPARLISVEGTHLTPAGRERLADAVADSVRRQLYHTTRPVLKTPAAGPEAAAEYQKVEAERDALVPPAFRALKAPEFPVPADAAAWAKARDGVKAKVVASLGDLPPRPAKPAARLVSAEIRPGYRLERLALDNGVDGEMSALLLIPDGLKGPAPAVLWLHSSSYDHRQLLLPNANGGEEPLGETFAKRGWVVFAPDAAWYGDRAGRGPAGARELTREQQESLHKYHLWFGRTLWGMFVRDDQVALDYLCSRPEVDAKKIGTTGISMGSTRAWWLAAVDDRIAATVGVACLTRYENLLKHGNLRAHGLYYFVFGLLKHFDTEAVAALSAPRPLLFLTGDLDYGSPADGVKVIEAKTGALYKSVGAGEKFRSVLYAGVGHVYTPEMRREMLAWFDQWLK